jgi:hypothetical protein
MEQLGGGAHRRGWTAVTLRRSPVRRRGSGGGKPVGGRLGDGKHVQRSGVDMRGERHAREEKGRPAAVGSF